MKNRSFVWILLSALVVPMLPAEAQLRRPGIVSIKREDRTTSRLNQENGAIYVEGMIAEEVVVHVDQKVPAYTTLTGDRWIGDILPNQRATLLAVSERAYRIKAQAKQGQVAGWVSKAVISGLPADFEVNLVAFYERYEVVRELIENEQVALGMTVDEVTASIGPPDKRSSKVTTEGRTDSLEYISYERVPQTRIGFDAFGNQVPVTQYIEVPDGRVTIDFSNDTVVSIEESEGIEFGQGAGILVPQPIYLF